MYSTVDEGGSANIIDVGKYLDKLKTDLHIGENGYPQKILLTGDQQTYKLTKDLQANFPLKYNWFYAVPGDWHLLKLTAELIKSIIWDGGFKEMCVECGHKKELNQWQDIHIMLSALHEVLLRKCTIKYEKRYPKRERNENKFWDFVAELMKTNNDEVSRFWAELLTILNTYMGLYFAIRSGNFMLRNSCIKEIALIFFAYSRDKYEELTLTNLQDYLTFPQELLDELMEGKWTISFKGNPYHNLALDEGHECFINRRLKQITSRPSHFRTVQLADFMAYLDVLLRGVENYICKNSVIYR